MLLHELEDEEIPKIGVKTELFLWYIRLGNLSFNKLLQMAKLGELPKWLCHGKCVRNYHWYLLNCLKGNTTDRRGSKSDDTKSNIDWEKSVLLQAEMEYWRISCIQSIEYTDKLL